ncbi:MAG: aminopeptidase P family protein [Rikenellaceae bacterium]
MFSSDKYAARRAKLRNDIESGIILLPGNRESSTNYPSNTYHFRQDSTFLYFFGLNVPELVGVIDADSGVEMLVGEDITIDDIIWMGVQPTINAMAQSVGVTRSCGYAAFEQYINDAVKAGRRIHFLPPYRADITIFLSELLGMPYRQVSKNISVKLALGVVAQREAKDAEEIEEIERACRIGYMMHTKAMSMCREGLKEQDIAGEIEGIAMRYGAGVSFASIVSQDGQTLHNHYHGNELKNGRLLLVDAGAETNMNYCSDYTRTFPVSGKFTTKQKEIYEIVLAAHDHAFNISKSEMLYRDIHLDCCKELVKGLKELGLMKGDVDAAVEAGAHFLFMPHGLGHNMGLDVHDMENIGEKYVGYDQETERSEKLGQSSLRMGRRLREGFVMTVEPGIYFIPDLINKWKNEKLNTEFVNFDALDSYYDFGGIRIEDDILITKDSCRILGEDKIPSTVAEVEEFMQANR